MIGYIGVILAMALLIGMAYKRWNVMIISIVAALVAGLANGINVFEIFSGYFLPSAVAFIQRWLLVFTCGAIFSEFMSRSKSVVSIAYTLNKVAGKEWGVAIIAAISFVLTLCAVSPYVQIFILWPICVVFARETKIPRGIWIAAFYVGMMAVSCFPGSSSGTNIMVVSLLGVSAASAPGLALVYVILYFVLGVGYLMWQSKKQLNKGNLFVESARDAKLSVNDDGTAPNIVIALIPVIVVLALVITLTSGTFGVKLDGTASVYTAIAAGCLVCLLLNFKTLKPQLKEMLVKSSTGGINPTMNAALITGFVGVVSATAAFTSFTESIQNLGGHPYFQVYLATNIISFVSASATVSIPTVVNTFGASWLAAGVNPAVLRPLILGNASPFTLGPHSGGLHGVMDFAGSNLKDCYSYCFVAIMLNSLRCGGVITVLAVLFA